MAGTWHYQGCPDVTDNDFKQTVLIGKSVSTAPLTVDASMVEPMELDFIDNNTSNPSFYYTQRSGEIKYYNGATKAVEQVGKIPVHYQGGSGGGDDCGLKGIAVDPNFKTNGWIYTFGCQTDETPEAFKISRWTVTNHKLDMASQRPIWKVRAEYSTHWHNGGSMHFDKYGDLWTAVGKNSSDDPNTINESNQMLSAEYGAANMHNGRGAVIRLHPLPFPDAQKPAVGLGTTYSVPKGNMGDYYGMLFKKQGKLDLSNEYMDPNKVLPEVFAKGLRDPWTLDVDFNKHIVVWGENGVNRAGKHEEHNWSHIPGFFGFPYFAGDPAVTNCGKGATDQTGCPDQTYFLMGNKDPLAPMNTSKWNDGPKQLPPAIVAAHPYQRSSAMTGPVYLYDPNNPSTVKFPPHFHNLWLLWDFKRGYKGDDNQNSGMTKWAKVAGDPPGTVEEQDFLHGPNHKFYSVLESEFGPDGALYVISYASWFATGPRTSISKVEYTGTCRPTTLVGADKAYYPEPGYGCMTQGDPNYDPKALAEDKQACASGVGVAPVTPVPGQFQFFDRNFKVTEAGFHRVSFYDMRGLLVKTFEGTGERTYALPASIRGVTLMVKVETPKGKGLYKVAVL